MQIEKRVDAEEARNERFDYSNPLLLCTLLLSAFFLPRSVGVRVEKALVLFCKLDGAIVAGHFQIAHPAEGSPVAPAAENDCAFPIVWSQSGFSRQLLRLERCFHFQFNGQHWNRHFPVDGIACARNRACPIFAGRLQREVSCAQMRGLATGIHVRPGGVRINRTIFAADVKEHHLAVVFELNTQPIPAGLVGIKLMGEEFMIHPTGAAYFKFLVTEVDYTGGRQSRKRNIVRCTAGPLRFLADAIFTVDDWRFFRVQGQMQLKARIESLQIQVVAVPLNLPIPIPETTEGFAHRGDAWAGTIGAFRMIELTAIQIAQSEMREVEILHVPSRGLSGITADGLPEESQFESEPPAVNRFQISGVVPPFGLKIRMIEMVAREFVAVSR